MLTAHSIVSLNNAELLNPSEISSISNEYNPHLYMILGISKWYIKQANLIDSNSTIDIELESEDGCSYKNTIRFIDKTTQKIKVIDSVKTTKDNRFLVVNKTEKYQATDIMWNYCKEFTPLCKILYIGKAHGNKNSRTAKDRLISHSTVQKILSDSNDLKIDYDIKVLVFSIIEYKVATTLGDVSVSGLSVEDIGDFPSDKNLISLVEAKLINYFKPEYNQTFTKGKVPKISDESYNDYFTKDFNSMIIDFRNLGEIFFYTDNIKSFNTFSDFIDYEISGNTNTYGLLFGRI
ncbi:TPA: type I restriction endonuclease subunit S [Streptococcus suis]|nr:type I restriction endonuclease subunit S [Streptococcus suis]